MDRAMTMAGTVLALGKIRGMAAPSIPFTHSYARLPERFFARVTPTPVAQPRLVQINRPLARELGWDIDALDEQTLASLLGGEAVPDGAEPISMAYAGHQFGVFVPRLGDGRAILLGELGAGAGVRREVQLKGAGRTPYSRQGDGRAALGPVLREYLVSEAMHALGIPATRALAAVSTGEQVLRERPLPGAVFTRVAASHVRVGTFQYFAARGDVEALRTLADYVIDRHYPQARQDERPVLTLLRTVAARQARLVARWQSVGFVHGVMNTDNMAVSGETIDFGPCAFLENYDPMMVFSSIDHAGRYAFGRQPIAAQWNIARFAEALLPLIDADLDRAVELAQPVITEFVADQERERIAAFAPKLGLEQVREGDGELIDRLLAAMHAGGADFTATFRALCAAVEGPPAEADEVSFLAGEAFRTWSDAWRSRLALEPRPAPERARAMRLANPAYIPRNHLVEAALRAAVEEQDLEPFRSLLAVVSQPFEEQPGAAHYARAARSEERVLQTFCGT
jgi:uncharacterized protein YdiU (UPF0061 family)